MGLPANLAGSGELPDPAELERIERQILQELSRLRF